MSNFLKLLETGHFYDNTDMIDEFLSGTHRESLCDAKGTGISTLLSTLSYYLDRRYDSADMFSSMKISNSKLFRKYLNQCIVIKLDFSDFNCTSYPDAIAYFRWKMSDVYKIQFDLVKVDEDFLEIIEETAEESHLSRSLFHLIWNLKYKQINIPIALLIDNLALVEKIAHEYQYDKKMGEFLGRYYIEDIHHYCEIFLLVGDIPAEHREGIWRNHLWGNRRYLSYFGFDVYPESIHSICWEKYIVPIDKQYSIKDGDEIKDANLCQDWKQILLESHRKLEYEKEQKRIRDEQLAEEKRKRYQEKLSDGITKLSRNLGVWHFEMNKNSEGYRRITACLENLYDKHFKNDSEIYEYFQQIKTDEPTDIKKNAEYYKYQYFEDETNGICENIWENTDSYWNYFSFYKDKQNQSSFSQSVKLYLSLNTTDISERFVSLTKYLMDHLQYDFAIKVSRYNRLEHICIWIDPADYEIVQAYLRTFAKKCKPIIHLWSMSMVWG